MDAIILAAGRGTRMKNTLPKVLVEIESEPMIKRIKNALSVSAVNNIIVVVGNNHQLVHNILKNDVVYVRQMIPLGTMDAFVQALPLVMTSSIIVTNGDIPYLSKDIIEDVINYYQKHHLKNLCVAMRLKNPTGFGRIKEDGKTITFIEEKHLTKTDQTINLVNVGLYILESTNIYQYLPFMKINQETNEYYITDYLNFLGQNQRLSLLIYPETYELKSVNDLETLNNLVKERNHQK